MNIKVYDQLYAMSKRKDQRDAVCDLRSREGTTLEKIGFVNLDDGNEHGRVYVCG